MSIVSTTICLFVDLMAGFPELLFYILAFTAAVGLLLWTQDRRSEKRPKVTFRNDSSPPEENDPLSDLSEQ